MLKKLRKQFIATNMFLVSVVILVVFSVLMLISYNYEKGQSVDALQLVLQKMANTDASNLTEKILTESPQDVASGSGMNNRVQTVVIMTETDNMGNIIYSEIRSNVMISQSVLNKITSYALTSNEDVGTIAKYSLRYLREPIEQGGYRIAFADISTENATLTFMLRVYILCGLVIFSILFLISDYMAHKAITPVEKSWNNQNRFVADASHELKTPLTVILANMDIMLASPESSVEEQKKWIDNTKSEARRMTQLVNDMLFLAKSDAAVEQSYNFMPVNMSHVVEDCVLTFESVAFEKGVDLSSHVKPNIVINADEAKLKQVVMVLLDNAAKYVDEKGKIFVLLDSNSKHVKLVVSNTGTPIPKEKQSHVFERFYRADESRARERGGYGLGLSIAGNIIQQHNGKLSLEYSDNRGTGFSVTLPVKQSSMRKNKKS